MNLNHGGSFRGRNCCSDVFRFFYEGQRVSDNDTPKTLEMEDGDTIEAHIGQVRTVLDKNKCCLSDSSLLSLEVAGLDVSFWN